MGAHATSAVVLLVLAVLLTVTDPWKGPTMEVHGPRTPLACREPAVIDVRIDDDGHNVDDADIAGEVRDAAHTKALPIVFRRMDRVYRARVAPAALRGGAVAFVSARVGRTVLESSISWTYAPRCRVAP
jgi:hypothetical protein